MRTVAEHLAEALTLVRPLPAAEVVLEEAAGLVLAADVVADAPLPRWDNSAMDGYAVRSADVTSGDAVLTVVADVPAGSTAGSAVAAGTAARIMTGAPLPPGADAVVPVEQTDGGTSRVHVRAGVAAGAHVRRAGEDVVAGTVVVAAGTLLGPAQVAACATVGVGAVRVHRRPRVAVLSTGSELVAPGEPLGPGQIPDSNSHLLAAAARAVGCEVRRVGAVPDRPGALREALDAVDGQVDLVVTSGGVSVGAYDVVKELLAPAGVGFHRVAMQPGKPQGLGRLPGGTPVLCLPGNPVSAFVSFEVFVRPVVGRLRGLVDVERPWVVGLVDEGWRPPHGRDQYMPVRLRVDEHGTLCVRPAAPGGSGSHLVAGLAGADGLARVPAGTPEVAPGDRVLVTRTDA